MDNVVDLVQKRIQYAVLVGTCSITDPRNELAVLWLNAPSVRDVANVVGSSKREEQVVFTTHFIQTSWRTNTFQDLIRMIRPEEMKKRKWADQEVMLEDPPCF